jgi:DNA-binding LytR/AlgR family response regulator
MNPTALIAEDEPLLAEGLRADLAALWPELRIAACVGDGASALEHALARAPDVCFFDIRMPGLSGLEAAQALAEDWPEGRPFPLIVFVSAYDQYALAAFDAQAVAYLVKPVARDKLAECVARLKSHLAARAAPPQALEQAVAQLRALIGAPTTTTASVDASPRLAVIQAQVGAVVHLVPVDEVLYFEAADKYVRVVTAEREHLIRLSLKELLPQLDPANFWQVHRGTIIQVRCIREARREESGKVTLFLRERPETLTVSRLYAHLFKGQ